MEKEILRTRGVRMSDPDWNDLSEIAKNEDKMSKARIHTADIIRRACKEFLDRVK